MLTRDEIETLFRDRETDRVERKELAKAKDRIGQAICAFANDLPRHGATGVVFVGLTDDGKCANLAITDNLLLDLAGLRGDGKILPFPAMAVSAATFDGCEVIVIQVEPSDNPPVKYDGRVWIRIGPRRAIATAEEERRLVEKRRMAALPFDMQPVPGATVADLDLRRFEAEYLPAVISPEALAENRRSREDQLLALRLIGRNQVPTPTGLLMLGKNPRHWFPGAYIQFIRFSGTEITDPVKDEKEISGVLTDQLRQIDEVCQANIAVALDMSATQHRKSPDYPLVALRQILRNAMLHRSYDQTNAPVRIYWYADRIEISSPGSVFGQVTRDNFGQPGVADYRNPTLAEALKAMGLIEKFGVGIPLARKALGDNGNPPPEFRVEDTSVLAILRPRQ